ncbi:hypothetical protein OpiT1DRAFT_05685 [Opitutaceae bacterium TAV1]|nr:hypothetical protein OpiT1DRAFT_05685 [Opitutaceae bacterium TAV1]
MIIHHPELARPTKRIKFRRFRYVVHCSGAVDSEVVIAAGHVGSLPNVTFHDEDGKVIRAYTEVTRLVRDEAPLPEPERTAAEYLEEIKALVDSREELIQQRNQARDEIQELRRALRYVADRAGNVRFGSYRNTLARVTRIAAKTLTGYDFECFRDGKA